MYQQISANKLGNKKVLFDMIVFLKKFINVNEGPLDPEEIDRQYPKYHAVKYKSYLDKIQQQ